MLQSCHPQFAGDGVGLAKSYRKKAIALVL